MGKKYAQLSRPALELAKKHGPAAAGALALLVLADGDYDNLVRTTARELCGILGYSDYHAVKRVLGALEAEGLIGVRATAAGTLITLAEGLDGAGQSTTLARGKTQQSVGQNATGPLFPLQTPYPKPEAFINKQPENKKNIRRKKPCELWINPDAGTFRAEAKTEEQKYAGWYVKKYLPELYAAATAQSTREWYELNGRRVGKILRMAQNTQGFDPLEIAMFVTVRVAALKRRAAEKNPDLAPWGLPAVINSFDAHYDAVLKQLREEEARASRERRDW